MDLLGNVKSEKAAFFFQIVIEKVSEGTAFDVVYADFSQAFDNVSCGNLVKRVRACGIHEKMVN